MSHHPVSSDIRFSAGAVIEPANLVNMRALAGFLPLHKQRKILSDLSGSHASAVRGRGLDYAEVRAYQPGDDIRAMDWRVTARTGDAHIKVFKEERERPVIIVCDLRSGMHFGPRRAFKSVLAADLSALLAWAAMDHGDRIGALLFSDQDETDLRPKTGRKQVLQLINALSREHPQAFREGRMAQMCRHLRRVIRPGSAVYFISDFAGFDDECEQQLFNLTQHSDLVAIQVSDPLEAELPPPGVYNFAYQNTRQRVNAADKTLRQRYHQVWLQRQQQLRHHMLRLKTPLISLSTSSSDPMSALRSGLGLQSVSRHSGSRS